VPAPLDGTRGHTGPRQRPAARRQAAALGRVDPAATATVTRSAPFVVEILANWTDPTTADANIDWAQQLFGAMTAFSTGKTNFKFPRTRRTT
jgi:hypothetical protein